MVAIIVIGKFAIGLAFVSGVLYENLRFLFEGNFKPTAFPETTRIFGSG